MDTEKILAFYKEHRGAVIGAAAGLLLAILILLIGFFRVFFIAILTGVGYYIGKKMHEDKNYIKNLLDRVLPPGTYR